MRASSTFLCCLFLLQTAQAQRGPAPVVVSPVVERELRQDLSFVGTVRASRQSRVASDVEGRVLQLVVREGQSVEAGQELVRIRSTELDIELAGARAELDLRQQELLELKNGTRPEELERAEAVVASTQAEVLYREWALKKTENLLKNQGTSEDSYRQALLALERAQALAREARAALDLAVAGPRTEAIAQAEARVAVQAQQILRLEDRQLRYQVRAPFAGYVVAELTEAGQWLDRGSAVIELAQLDTLKVSVAVPEDFVTQLQLGDSVKLVIDAVPDEDFVGEIVQIVPRADLSSRSFPVHIRLINRVRLGMPLLQAGMRARALLSVGDSRPALLVPKDAIVLGGRQSLVYVLVDDPENAGGKLVQPVTVKLGSAWLDALKVEGELQVGQQVVVRGNERLRPGQAVFVQEVLPTLEEPLHAPD